MWKGDIGVSNFNSRRIDEMVFEIIAHTIRSLMEPRYWKFSKFNIFFGKTTKNTHNLKIFVRTVSFENCWPKCVKCWTWNVSIKSTSNNGNTKITLVIDALFYWHVKVHWPAMLPRGAKTRQNGAWRTVQWDICKDDSWVFEYSACFIREFINVSTKQWSIGRGH